MLIIGKTGEIPIFQKKAKLCNKDKLIFLTKFCVFRLLFESAQRKPNQTPIASAVSAGSTRDGFCVVSFAGWLHRQ